MILFGLLDSRPCLISAPVIYENDLIVSDCIGDGTFYPSQELRDRLLFIVRWYDDG